MGRGLTPDLANKLRCNSPLTMHLAHMRVMSLAFRNIECTPGASCAFLCRHFCSWRCFTFVDCIYCPIRKYSALCSCYVADFFSGTRWIGRKSGWRKYLERCKPCSFLGCTRNGGHCWRWQFIWGCCCLIISRKLLKISCPAAQYPCGLQSIYL